jgi:GNAT superfamily N-acetyltransferase
MIVQTFLGVADSIVSCFKSPIQVLDDNRVAVFGKKLPPFQPLKIEYYEQPKEAFEARSQNVTEALSAKQLDLKPIQFRAATGKLIGQVADGESAQELSREQFRALYEAVGSASGWWPLTDTKFDYESLFGATEMFMLQKDGRPIGFGCIQRHYKEHGLGGDGKSTDIIYVGVIPSLQGRGDGGAFFDALNDIAWRDSSSVLLNTCPQHDRMTGRGGNEPATSLYRDREFRLIETKIRDPKDGKSNINELNLVPYYKREVALHNARWGRSTSISQFYEAKLEQAFSDVRPVTLDIKLGAWRLGVLKL